MNKSRNWVISGMFLSLFATGASAGGSAEASARALESSVQAIGYSLQGGFKLVSGAAALPLMVAGEIGRVSGEAGRSLWDEANAPPVDLAGQPVGRGPLPVTDEIVTAGPKPGEQLEQSR